jgi:hypothetical protein
MIFRTGISMHLSVGYIYITKIPTKLGLPLAAKRRRGWEIPELSMELSLAGNIIEVSQSMVDFPAKMPWRIIHFPII